MIDPSRTHTDAEMGDGWWTMDGGWGNCSRCKLCVIIRSWLRILYTALILTLRCFAVNVFCCQWCRQHNTACFFGGSFPQNGVNVIDTAPWYGQGKSEEVCHS